MTKKVQSADQVIHEFPDDTPQEVIDGVMKQYVGEPKQLKSEDAFRQLKLGARYIAETPGLVMAGLGDMAAGVANLGVGALDWAQQKTGGDPIDYRFPTDAAAQVYEGFNQITGVQPETKQERYAEAISRGLMVNAATFGTGSALSTQAASPVTRAVGETLTKNPAMQGAMTTTGVAGSHAVAEAGGGPLAQAGAGILAGGAPAAIKYGGGAALRGTMRGGETGRQNLAKTVDDFNRAGTEPTVGQGTQGRVAQASEGGMSRAPGSAGRMTKTAESQATEIAANLEQKASQLAGKTSAERAGRAITEGVSGDGGFLSRFRATQKQLYGKLESLVKPETRTSVAETAGVLDEMTAGIAGARETSKALSNPALRKIYDALYDDLKLSTDGRLPFKALSDLRSKVGDRLSTAGIADDISKVEWKRLYAGLSRDMEAAVKADGSPEAQQAWARANAHTKAGHARIDRIDAVLKKNGGPEKVFTAAMSGTKEGATVLRSVMQSLDREHQKILTATVLRRMGRANPGQQNELGDVFSTERFLTNWNGLSTEAKATLFNRYGPSFRADMDAVSRVAANLRSGSQVFRNPSGTAQAATQNMTVGAFGLAVITGQFETAAGIAAGVGALNMGARAMTNPSFVHWLARTSKMPAAAIPAQLAILSAQAAKTGDEDLALFAVTLEEAYGLDQGTN